jgi:hypothetical protein
MSRFERCRFVVDSVIWGILGKWPANAIPDLALPYEHANQPGKHYADGKQCDGNP